MMKPILVETTSDNTGSIQLITPEINGTTQPSEVCLLIEDADGDHFITLTPKQAQNLIKQLNSMLDCI